MITATVILLGALLVALGAFLWLRHQHAQLLEGPAAQDAKGFIGYDRGRSMLSVVTSKGVEIVVKKAQNGETITRQRAHLTTKLPFGRYELALNFPSGFKGKMNLELQEDTKQLAFMTGVLRLTYLGKPSRAALKIELLNGPHGLKGKLERFIDKGVTEIELPTGSYKIELKSNGNYLPFSKTFEIKEGTVVDLTASLLSPGYLEVQTVPNAKMYVDSDPLGNVGELKGLKLSPGRHSVKIIYPNGFELKQNVEIRDGNRTYLRIDTGKVTWKLPKGGAPTAKLELYLSGKTAAGRYKGELSREKPTTLELPVGYYQFTASSSGYISHKGTFTLRHGKPLEIELNLKPRRSRKNLHHSRHHRRR